jgi:hypothetical protein
MKRILKIRIWLIIFIIGLAISGITAFPLQWELGILNQYIGMGSAIEPIAPDLSKWISYVNKGLINTNQDYPFISYGTDWLAFAHIVLAILFIGPLIDPVKNIWVIQFGIISCVLVFPLALICGPIRGIPFYWQLIDCSFGLFGAVPLLIVYSHIKKLTLQTTNEHTQKPE